MTSVEIDSVIGQEDLLYGKIGLDRCLTVRTPPRLQDYEEEEAVDTEATTKVDAEKKGYVGIHATGFKELMLKPELLQAVTACGFEHPSEGTLRC